MTLRRLPVLCGAFLLTAWGADKPNLSGSWHWNPAKSDARVLRVAALTWVIDQQETAIQISEISQHPDGKETRMVFECSTDGKECSKRAKDPAIVSFWYNGPALVEMEYRGHNRENVLKRRMRLSEDGKLMNVELIPIAGSGQSGKLVFEKQ